MDAGDSNRPVRTEPKARRFIETEGAIHDISWTFAQVPAKMEVMWSLDPEIVRQLQHVRQMVLLQHQTPTREWPLIVEESRDELLVVREWPDGSITAYTVPVPESGK